MKSDLSYLIVIVLINIIISCNNQKNNQGNVSLVEIFLDYHYTEDRTNLEPPEYIGFKVRNISKDTIEIFLVNKANNDSMKLKANGGGYNDFELKYNDYLKVMNCLTIKNNEDLLKCFLSEYKYVYKKKNNFREIMIEDTLTMYIDLLKFDKQILKINEEYISLRQDSVDNYKFNSNLE